MQKLPKNYKKMLVDLQAIYKRTGIFIDSMMFAKGDDFFGYVPAQEIEKNTDQKWPDDKRTKLTQDCYEKSSAVAERYGLTLLLAHFILSEGSTMLMGTPEAMTDYLKKIKDKGTHNAKTSKH